VVDDQICRLLASDQKTRECGTDRRDGNVDDAVAANASMICREPQC